MSEPASEVVAAPDAAPARPSAARRALTFGFYALVLVLLAVYLSKIDLHALARIELRPSFLLLALAVGLCQRLWSPSSGS